MQDVKIIHILENYTIHILRAATWK